MSEKGWAWRGAWVGTAGPSPDISSEVPALPAACGRAMSSPPVFLGIPHTWGPLLAGAGILRKTMAPVGPTGLCVLHAAGARAHGSQAPTTSWARSWGLDTRGLVCAMGRSGEGCSRQRNVKGGVPEDVPFVGQTTEAWRWAFWFHPLASWIPPALKYPFQAMFPSSHAQHTSLTLQNNSLFPSLCTCCSLTL